MSALLKELLASRGLSTESAELSATIDDSVDGSTADAEAQAIDDAVEEYETASETVEALESLALTLESTLQSGRGYTALEMALHHSAVSAHYKLLGLAAPSSPSLESFASPSDREHCSTLALEDLMDGIEDLVNAIVNFIIDLCRKIKSFILDIIRGEKTKNERLEGEVRRARERKKHPEFDPKYETGMVRLEFSYLSDRDRRLSGGLLGLLGHLNRCMSDWAEPHYTEDVYRIIRDVILQPGGATAESLELHREHIKRAVRSINGWSEIIPLNPVLQFVNETSLIPTLEMGSPEKKLLTMAVTDDFDRYLNVLEDIDEHYPKIEKRIEALEKKCAQLIKHCANTCSKTQLSEAGRDIARTVRNMKNMIKLSVNICDDVRHYLKASVLYHE